MLHTTFEILKAAGACTGEYGKLVKALGGLRKHGKTKPIPLSVVLEHTSLPSAHWCLWYVLPEEEAKRDRLTRLFACEYVERNLSVFEKERPGDLRPRRAIAVSRRFASGEATLEELVVVCSAAWDAWDDAWDAARDAAYVGAWGAAKTAAQDAARDVARDVAKVASERVRGAWSVVRDGTRGAAVAEQTEIFLRLLETR